MSNDQYEPNEPDYVGDVLFRLGCWLAIFIGGAVFWVGCYRWIMGD